jgi:hypothetical protein
VGWPDQNSRSFGQEVQNVIACRAQPILYFTHSSASEQGLIQLPKPGVFNFILNMDSGESQNKEWFHMDWYNWGTYPTLEFGISDVQTWKSYQRWSCWSFISLLFCTSTKQIIFWACLYFLILLSLMFFSIMFQLFSLLVEW